MTMDHPLSLPWLVIATPQLQDSNFKQAVVLIVEHSDKGSMGFVLNRPIQASLADLVSVKGVKIPDAIPVWYGGPVDRSTGIILHDCKAGAEGGPAVSTPSGTAKIGSGSWSKEEGVSLALSSSETALIDMVDYSQRRLQELAQLAADGAPLPEGLYPYRFLVGYSGWAAGQLEAELNAGAWIQARATWNLLFNTNWKSMWDDAMSTVGVNPKILAPTVHQYLN